MTGNPTLMTEPDWLRACAAEPDEDTPRLAREALSEAIIRFCRLATLKEKTLGVPE